jgi:tetratricopeptide (TPR) repeat protein
MASSNETSANQIRHMEKSFYSMVSEKGSSSVVPKTLPFPMQISDDDLKDRTNGLSLDIIRFIFDRAKALEEDSKFDSAIEELQKVQEVLEQMSSGSFLKIEAFLHEKIGDIFSKKKEYDKALKHYQRDLEINSKLKVPFLLSIFRLIPIITCLLCGSILIFF